MVSISLGPRLSSSFSSPASDKKLDESLGPRLVINSIQTFWATSQSYQNSLPTFLFVKIRSISTEKKGQDEDQCTLYAYTLLKTGRGLLGA